MNAFSHLNFVPLVKSPPWIMKFLMTLWKTLPLYLNQRKMNINSMSELKVFLVVPFALWCLSQLTEVVGCQRHRITEKTDNNFSGFFASNGNIEEHL